MTGLEPASAGGGGPRRASSTSAPEGVPAALLGIIAGQVRDRSIGEGEARATGPMDALAAPTAERVQTVFTLGDRVHPFKALGDEHVNTLADWRRALPMIETVKPTAI